MYRSDQVKRIYTSQVQQVTVLTKQQNHQIQSPIGKKDFKKNVKKKKKCKKVSDDLICTKEQSGHKIGLKKLTCKNLTKSKWRFQNKCTNE